MEILFFLLLCAVFSGMIASNKHRSTVNWFLAGLLFGPFGLLVGLMPPCEDKKRR